MRIDEVPVKTAAGVDELARRLRGVSQRHRTVLLLVDGNRTLQQVLKLAEAAGVPARVFNELLAMQLVAAPEIEAAAPVSGAAGPGGERGPASENSDSSLLPAARSLLPESGWSTLSGATLAPEVDGPLEEARALLIKALREQAPVTGTLTLMKLRRAANRDELAALLDEVEQRLRKPRRMIVVAQTMRHVRHLLSLSTSRQPRPAA